MDSLGHYNILEKIGAGGMGEVYRARDTRLGRTVAIKVLPDSVSRDPERCRRFQREAQAAASVSHPSVATLFEVGEDDGRLFLVFEFVPGRPLRAEIGGRPMPTRSALDLAIQLADAVAEAHAAGVVHRDLKPDNVLVTPKGRAKILDFGLARWTQGGAAREAMETVATTEPGLVLGTLAYMSPEQVMGQPADERSDIFSLGLVILEMLVGRNPFVKEGRGVAAAAAILHDEVPRPSRLHPPLPEELDPILLKALAKRPDDRYQTAVTLAAELRAVAAILDVRFAESEPAAPMPPPRRRSRAAWLAAAAVVVALGSGLWLGRGRIAALLGRFAGPLPAPVIAVVPLDAPPNDQIYFADGLTDDLITRLGQTPGLSVLGRSATRDSRGRSPKAVAEELGARVVLTGAVRREGGRLRVTVELVEPASGLQIWQDRFDRPLTDVLAVQADIADEVARALRVTLAASAGRARTRARLVDAQAYDLYLRARDASVRRERRRAIELYEEALRADRNLAEAHAGLAEALYLEAVGEGNITAPGLFDRIRRAAAEAVDLDPDLPQAQLAMGLGAARLEDTLANIRRAIELDPSYAEAFHQLGDQLLGWDPERALAFYRKALELDARLHVTWADSVTAYTLLGRPEDAREQMRRGTAADPANRDLLAAGWFLALMAGDADRALKAVSALGDLAGPATPVALTVPGARTLVLAGRTRDAEELLVSALEREPTFCEGRALLAGLLADRGAQQEARDRAVAIMDEARRERAEPPMARCAAVAAAAVGDAARTAEWLERIASNQDLLRFWALEVTGFTGDMPVRFRLYPWNKVAQHHDVQEAMTAIEKAYAPLRALAAEALAGVF